MRKLILVISLLFYFGFQANAQLENPVNWVFSAKKIANKQFELHLKANVQSGWHIYAQDAGEGPVPTSFEFNPNPLVKFDAKTTEIGKLESKFDPNFNSKLKYYNNEVDFVKKVTVKSTATTTVKGTLTYMVCNEKKCLPPKEIPFSITLTGGK
jgi:DsbC/DsbD-like thiol-disulfide interchange protein